MPKRGQERRRRREIGFNQPGRIQSLTKTPEHLRRISLCNSLIDESCLCIVLFLHLRISACQDLGLWHVPFGSTCAGRSRHHLALLVYEFEVVPAQKVGDGGELRSVACSVIVELKERDGEKLHILGDAEDLCDES